MWVFTRVLWRRHCRSREGSGDLEIILKERNGPGSRGGSRRGGMGQFMEAWKGLKKQWVKPIMAFRWHSGMACVVLVLRCWGAQCPQSQSSPSACTILPRRMLKLVLSTTQQWTLQLLEVVTQPQLLPCATSHHCTSLCFWASAFSLLLPKQRPDVLSKDKEP